MLRLIKSKKYINKITRFVGRDNFVMDEHEKKMFYEYIEQFDENQPDEVEKRPFRHYVLNLF